MTAIASLSTSILVYLLMFREEECRVTLSSRRLLASTMEHSIGTEQQQMGQQNLKQKKKFRLDFRKILGKIPEATLDIPFPYNEQKVVKYIREKLCPKSVPVCSDSHAPPPLSYFANTIHGDIKVLLDSNQTVTLDDIASGYTRAMEAFVSYSFTHFLGVPMQQGPKDAFALMDLIWRVKPDLLIEFGTSGGGSAFFYGLIMTAYNPGAHVITMDPDRQEDWNKWAVKKICPHCVNARDTPFWKHSGVIEFIHANPIDVVSHVEARITQWGSKKIMIMEDSNHLVKSVLGNILAYSHLVTKDAFIVVQDTKLSRPGPPSLHKTKDTSASRFKAPYYL